MDQKSNIQPEILKMLEEKKSRVWAQEALHRNSVSGNKAKYQQMGPHEIKNASVQQNKKLIEYRVNGGINNTQRTQKTKQKTG